MFQRKNLRTKCHEDWAKNVSSRLFTFFLIYTSVHIEKTSPPRGGHVFSLITTIFKVNQDIHKTNVLTKFHDDWTKNVTSREKDPPPGDHKTAPSPGGHVFPLITTIFKLARDIHITNVLTKYHDDRAKIVTSRVFTRNTVPPTGGHVFQWTETIFKLNQHIIKTNILTKLHKDWASNMTSTVFKLGQGIIGTNVLTKFHEDRTINVASRVFTSQMLTTDARRTTHDGQKVITKAHHEHVVLR
ncbi:hypothetical protein DPMN_150444 [Dreissena polymorpha]|uniref:Uncharacterized protein n=1 Tax=Dreissena polymorpha TaxID=45954 RepID=A0A9D4J6B7_DREPO|nr:hypothetical protein DPMN_150444 [Dreissena polymorpha]